MRLIIDYWWFWEQFEFKWASQKQMLELRRKILDSFTKKDDSFLELSKKIIDSKTVSDIFN